MEGGAGSWAEPKATGMDSDWLGRLVDRHAAARALCAAMVRYARGRGSEAFVASPPHAVPDKPAAWLFRVVRNGASMPPTARRRRRHESEAAARRPAGSRPSTTEQRLRRARPRDGRGELRSLPLEQREVIVAHLWGGLYFPKDRGSSPAARRALRTGSIPRVYPRCENGWGSHVAKFVRSELNDIESAVGILVPVSSRLIGTSLMFDAGAACAPDRGAAGFGPRSRRRLRSPWYPSRWSSTVRPRSLAVVDGPGTGAVASRCCPRLGPPPPDAPTRRRLAGAVLSGRVLIRGTTRWLPCRRRLGLSTNAGTRAPARARRIARARPPLSRRRRIDSGDTPVPVGRFPAPARAREAP